jgi:hypothetical protein
MRIIGQRLAERKTLYGRQRGTKRGTVVGMGIDSF